MGWKSRTLAIANPLAAFFVCARHASRKVRGGDRRTAKIMDRAAFILAAIKQIFSKLEVYLRKAAERNIPGL